MDHKFYRNRARVLRELAADADPLIKKRLLRLADNYDGMTTTKGTRDGAAEKAKHTAADSYGSDGHSPNDNARCAIR
jgi:hypothetical protein